MLASREPEPIRTRSSHPAAASRLLEASAPVGDTSLDAASHGHILPGPALDRGRAGPDQPARRTVSRVRVAPPVGARWRRGLAAGDERLIVNLSTWRTYEDLHQFVYRTALGGYVRRRLRWFVQPSGPTIVLWWVWSGHRPSTEEAFVRLEHLRARGPTARAFTPLRRFDPDGSPAFTWPRARRHQRTHPRTGLPGAMPFCIVLARINVVVRSCRSALAQAPEGVRLFLSASSWASRACWLCSSSPRPGSRPHLSSWRPSVARPCLLRAR